MREERKLSKGELFELWRIAESKILHLLDVLDHQLSSSEQKNIIKYIDVNEYGLAFEELVLTFLRYEKPLTREEFSEIEKVYNYFSEDMDEITGKIISDLRNQIAHQD